MVTVQEDYEENFGFDDSDDEQNINAILNDQQESRLGIVKNLLIIFFIISVGIGVFWGSFMLGKRVFTSTVPESAASRSESVAIEEELANFTMPTEEVLFEVESLKKEEKEVQPAQAQESAKPAPVESPGQPVKQASPQPQPQKAEAAPQIKKASSQPAKVVPASVMYKVIAGSYSKLDNAKTLEQALKQKGFDVYLAKVSVKGQDMWRVQVGAFDTVDQAKKLIVKIKATGNDAFYIQE